MKLSNADNTNLCLHIGMPKTGTSLLQSHVFPSENGIYIGKTIPGRSNPFLSCLEELRDLALGYRWMDGYEAKNRMETWVRNVLDIAKQHRNSSTIRISEEMLIRWPLDPGGSWRWPIGLFQYRDSYFSERKHPHPFAVFVADVLRPAWRQVGVVKVCLAVRRQADWLASMYAQLSNQIVAPSQADFEDQVAKIIARSDSFLDYNRLYTDFSEGAGRDGFTMLFYEEIKHRHFWEDLANSMALEPHRWGSYLDGHLPRTNVRSVAGGPSWRIRRVRDSMPLIWYYDRKMRSKGQAPSWAPTLAAMQMESISSMEEKFAKSGLFRMLWSNSIDRRRGVHVTLSDEVSLAVRRHCAASNQALSQMILRDLTVLGY